MKNLKRKISLDVKKPNLEIIVEQEDQESLSSSFSQEQDLNTKQLDNDSIEVQQIQRKTKGQIVVGEDQFINLEILKNNFSELGVSPSNCNFNVNG